MKRVPNYLTKFILKMGILMLIFTLCRILFFVYNSNHFPEARLIDLFAGMWFDLITTCLLFYPLIAIELFPLKSRSGKWFKKVTFTLTFAAIFFGTFLNLVDVEYFHHTTSRSNYGLFTMLQFGNDLFQQIPSFLADYWLLLVLLIAIIYGSVVLLKIIQNKPDDSSNWNIWKQTLIYVLMIGTFILIGRGGFVSKPIRPTQAAKFTESSNVQLILNSAFTVINSWGSNTLEEKHYFDNEELNKIYTTKHQFHSDGRNKGQNVVILILESFNIEHIGSLNGNSSTFTPFFDSMVDSSLVFPNAFANGKKSLDAVPAVLASIPKLMPDEYMLSNYMTNKIEGLPEMVEKMGYETAFFHGATNGSMNFDSFCDLLGFDHYFGRSEYNNEDDYDGTWGIYDDKFLSWSIDKMSEMKEPFFTTTFTISPHPPYEIPKNFETNSNESEMQQSIRYADFALEQFFEKASKQDWYNNTLFIMVADHTPGTSDKQYSSPLGITHIPLLMFHPSDTLYRGVNSKVVSQIDILPTVAEQLGYKEPFFSFGESMFNTDEGFSATMIGEQYICSGQIGDSTYILTFQNDDVTAVNKFENITLEESFMGTQIHIELEKKLKARIQKYHEALMKNKMTIE